MAGGLIGGVFGKSVDSLVKRNSRAGMCCVEDGVEDKEVK